jgi:hypothetical protein
MLNWFRRIVHRKTQNVFVYWDGRIVRRGDPIVLWRNLLAHEDYREDDFEFLKVESLRLKSAGTLSSVCRDVFGILPSDDGGLTELECIQILKSFRVYAGLQKKSGDLSQTSQQSTDTQVSPDAGEETNTNDDSESTSTSNGSRFTRVLPLPEESELGLTD